LAGTVERHILGILPRRYAPGGRTRPPGRWFGFPPHAPLAINGALNAAALASEASTALGFSEHGQWRDHATTFAALQASFRAWTGPRQPAGPPGNNHLLPQRETLGQQGARANRSLHRNSQGGRRSAANRSFAPGPGGGTSRPPGTWGGRR